MEQFAKRLLLILITLCSDLFCQHIPELSTVNYRFSPSDSLTRSASMIRSILDSCTTQAELMNRINQLAEQGIIQPLRDSATPVLITPNPAVRSIRVKGAFPLFRSEIEQCMTVRSGDFITEEKLDLQKRLITELFATSGSINPEISFEQEPIGNSGLVDLHVKIGSKKIKMVKRVIYRGTPQFGPAIHGWNFRVWHYSRLLFLPGRFHGEDLRDDQRKLREFYRSKGYADAEISVTDSIVNGSGKGNQFVVLIVTINSGSEQIMKFKRVSPFRRSFVKDVYDMKRKGNRSAGVIRSGTKELKSRLDQWGYDSAEVIVRDSSVLRGKRYPRDCEIHTVSVSVQKRKKVRSLKISGNENFSKKEIRSLCQTKKGMQRNRRYKGSYSESLFREDCQRVTNMMIVHGYLRGTVQGHTEPVGKRRVRVNMEIRENAPCRISRVNFIGFPDSLSEATLTTNCNAVSGSLWNRAEISSDRDRLISLLRSKGVQSAQVETRDSLSEDSASVVVTFECLTPQKSVIRTVSWWGNYFTTEKYLNHLIKLSPDSSFSQLNLNESVRVLRNSGLFNSVTPMLIHSVNKDSVDILFRLEELKRMEFSSAGGYGTENGLYLRGSFLHNNLHGMNRKFRTDGSLTTVEKSLGISFTEPNLFGKNLKVSTSVVWKLQSEKNVNFDTRSLENSYSAIWNPRAGTLFSLTPAYRLKQNIGVSGTELLTNESDISGVVIEDIRHTLLLKPELVIDRRDSFVKPTKGWYSKVESTLSHGINSLFDNYVRFVAESRLFFSPIGLFTVASRARIGVQAPYGENQYTPVDELFRLGGVGSVRGYDENLLFADSLGKSEPGMGAVTGSVEIRTRLLRSIEIPLFADCGSLSFSEDIHFLEPFKFTAGTGIRYASPIGPIGLVYGWKLNRSESDPTTGAYHFSIGYSF